MWENQIYNEKKNQNPKTKEYSEKAYKAAST